MKKLLITLCMCTGALMSAQQYWTPNGNTIEYTTDNVGIGTSAQAGYRLAVDGTLRSREVHVNQTNWPDYVFTDEHALPTLEEITFHIRQKGHLPNIPSAAEVAENGIALAEMNRLLLEKVEELTLYILEHDQRRKELQQRIEVLKASQDKK